MVGVQNDGNNDESLELYVTAAPPGDGGLTLRMSPEIADEVRTLLDEEGLAHSPAAEFSSGPELILEAVRVLGAAGGSVALARVVNAVIKRHDGKTFLLERDGEKIETTGFSEKEVERLIEKRARDQADREAEWKRITGDA